MISMNNYDKVINYAEKNNGYITAKEALKLEVNSTFLSNLVKEKKIERVGKGVYKLPMYPIDNLYIISLCSKNMCYSHATALYLHDMCDRIPLKYDITVPYNYSGSLLDKEEIVLRYVKDDVFNLGVTHIKTINELSVKVYDIEKTICDIIKDKNVMDKEIYSKALKSYVQRKDKDIFKLVKYAKKMNIEDEVVEIMEVIL